MNLYAMVIDLPRSMYVVQTPAADRFIIRLAAIIAAMLVYDLLETLSKTMARIANNLVKNPVKNLVKNCFMAVLPQVGVI